MPIDDDLRLAASVVARELTPSPVVASPGLGERTCAEARDVASHRVVQGARWPRCDGTGGRGRRCRHRRVRREPRPRRRIRRGAFRRPGDDRRAGERVSEEGARARAVRLHAGPLRPELRRSRTARARAGRGRPGAALRLPLQRSAHDGRAVDDLARTARAGSRLVDGRGAGGRRRTHLRRRARVRFRGPDRRRVVGVVAEASPAMLRAYEVGHDESCDMSNRRSPTASPATSNRPRSRSTSSASTSTRSSTCQKKRSPRHALPRVRARDRQRRSGAVGVAAVQPGSSSRRTRARRPCSITGRNIAPATLAAVLSGWSSSAIWMALSAAPLRRLSLDTNSASPRPSSTRVVAADAADVGRIGAGGHQAASARRRARRPARLASSSVARSGESGRSNSALIAIEWPVNTGTRTQVTPHAKIGDAEDLAALVAHLLLFVGLTGAVVDDASRPAAAR